MCGEVHDGGGGGERAVWRGWGDGHTRPSRTRVTACAMWGWAAVDPCTESENSEPWSVEAMPWLRLGGQSERALGALVCQIMAGAARAPSNGPSQISVGPWAPSK